MATVREMKGMTCGEIIFMPSVGFKEVADFAKELKDEEDRRGRGQYEKLYIRKRDDRYVIGLCHQGSDTGREYYFKITQMAQDRFGPDVRGWSLSSPVWVIE